MLVTGNAVPEISHSFERPVIFIPKWLDKRVETFSKNQKTLKDINGLFSILIPADVSFYLEQFSAIANHPAVKPYLQSFNLFSYADSTSWNTNISSKKASKEFDRIQGILWRAREANNKEHYSVNQQPLGSYVDNNAPQEPYDANIAHEMLASILGVDQHDTSVDLYNLRVIIGELDADTLTLRLETIDPDQNKLVQVLNQTEANIKKITQYYEFSKVMASPIGKHYSRLVLTSPSA